MPLAVVNLQLFLLTISFNKKEKPVCICLEKLLEKL